MSLGLIPTYCRLLDDVGGLNFQNNYRDLHYFII